MPDNVLTFSLILDSSFVVDEEKSFHRIYLSVAERSSLVQYRLPRKPLAGELSLKQFPGLFSTAEADETEECVTKLTPHLHSRLNLYGLIMHASNATTALVTCASERMQCDARLAQNARLNFATSETYFCTVRGRISIALDLEGSSDSFSSGTHPKCTTLHYLLHNKELSHCVVDFFWSSGSDSATSNVIY